MMNDIIIDVENLSIRFNLANQSVNNLKEYVIKMVKHELMFQEFMALKNINLQIRRGESWALIGSNGSGKSTLLKAISGILKPYTGSVSVHGSLAPLIELGAGFDGELTARENVFINGCLLGYSKGFMNEHFDEIINYAELWDFVDSPMKNYSSGMSARLGFAIATMVKPDVLICDEVLAVGDIAFQNKCKLRMKKMLEGGTTLVFVSHDMNTVKNLCSKAIWIEKGIEKMKGDCISVCEAYEKYYV